MAARLQRLLAANKLVGQDLELPAVLSHIVEAATELVGAAYGAIGTVGPDGRPEQVIEVGVGGPGGAPAAGSFLGVPVRVRDEVLGHLNLSDPRPDAFTAIDQELLEALAATAGVAISHARLFQDSRRREQWSVASAQITRQLLTSDADDALDLVAQRVLELAGADLVAVVLPLLPGDPHGELVVDHAVGGRRDEVTRTVLPAGTSMVGLCMSTGRPQVRDRVTSLSRLPAPSLGPAMAVPLLTAAGVHGSLLLVRDRGSPRFTAFDLEVVASFAGQAALALERADARLAGSRTRALEERDRIARDLHDHVVQRLFAAGLNIQSVCAVLGPGPEVDRLNAQIDEIDATIRQIRTTIFDLNRPAHRSGGVRAEVLAVVNATTVILAGPPEVTFRGPLDLLVPVDMYPDLLAVLREGLTNVGRHAAATRVEVLVSVDAHDLTVEVVDDGVGIAATARLSGLRNLARRASESGGSFEVGARDGRGTRLRWSVPLPTAGLPPQM